MNQTNLLNEHHSSTCLASFSALGLGDRKSSKLCPCLILPLHAPPPPMAWKDTILTLVNIDLPYRSFHIFPGNLVGSWLKKKKKKAHLQKPPASQALKTHVHGHLCLSPIPLKKWTHWGRRVWTPGLCPQFQIVYSFGYKEEEVRKPKKYFSSQRLPTVLVSQNECVGNLSGHVGHFSLLKCHSWHLFHPWARLEILDPREVRAWTQDSKTQSFSHYRLNRMGRRYCFGWEKLGTKGNTLSAHGDLLIITTEYEVPTRGRAFIWVEVFIFNSSLLF